MLRPDLRGNSSYTERDLDFAFHEFGISLLRRNAPAERGGTYGAARYSLAAANGNVLNDELYTIHTVSLAIGGHAQVIDWLGVFGEAGPFFNYHQDDRAIGGGTRIINQAGLATSLGVTLRRPSKTPTASSRVKRQSMDDERPSWNFGGYLVNDGFESIEGAGLLIPLSKRWLVRPDVGVRTLSFRPGDDDVQGAIGLSLLRRTEPSEHGWLYSAWRHSVTYRRLRSSIAEIGQITSLAVGAHIRLTDRLSAFGEAGPYLRFRGRETITGTDKRLSTGFTHGIGLSYAWADRTP
ncbi:MAG: hypothetical protein IT357_09035 [Gemmatimonadaceae bacterium]|nr:hypothetical protein [Gemmatimonadaceae bacterium]